MVVKQPVVKSVMGKVTEELIMLLREEVKMEDSQELLEFPWRVGRMGKTKKVWLTKNCKGGFYSGV